MRIGPYSTCDLLKENKRNVSTVEKHAGQKYVFKNLKYGYAFLIIWLYETNAVKAKHTRTKYIDKHQCINMFTV